MTIPSDLSGFVLAAFALAGSPGPANTVLAAAGAAFGLRRSLWLATGIITGVLTVMLLTATGLAGLVLALPGVAPVATVAGALYMLYLAWKIATAPPLTETNAEAQAPSLGSGYFVGAGNPKTFAAVAALHSGFALSPSDPMLEVALKLAALAPILVIVNVVWLLLGAALTRCFRDPRLNRIVNIDFAVALILSLAVAFAM
ncbi:MAG: LysE family translocator [Alphaproteobacteria bacterium]|nr:LysE family translocator [Alphaproteobacteria bacterium]